MTLPNTARPSLSAIKEKQGLTEPVDETLDQRKDIVDDKKTNSIKYTFSILNQHFKETEQDVEKMGNLPLLALISAPRDFFDKYKPYVADASKFIQNSLSREGSVEVISKVRKNPLDKENKKRALRMIVTEFINYENSVSVHGYNTLTDLEKKLISALTINEIVGLGVIEPLFQSPEITEIIANGPFDVQIELDGSIIQVPSVKFADRDALIELIERLFASVNKTWSVSNPNDRTNLYDNSRLTATHVNVSPSGPNLNIRKHEKYWTSPEQMVKWGAASEELMAYLGYAVYKGLSMLIVGSTGTGKALSYETNIPTPRGMVKMRDIQKGDKIFNIKGKVSTVDEIFEQGEKTIYEIKLSNNHIIEADLEHNWLLENDEVLTTEEIISRIEEESLYIPIKHSIIEYENENELPIHPYGLGLYLNDKECYEETLNDIKNYNKNLDFIPEVYETASSSDRQWLIKAYTKYSKINEEGEVKIAVTDKTKESLIRILSSLDYFIKEIRDDELIVLSKNWYKSQGLEYPEKIQIVSVNKTDRKTKMKCISVTDETKTFLCSDNFVTTHNTTLLAALSGYLPNNKRGMTIEKNIELKICPSKLFAAPLEEVLSKSGSVASGVSLRDLVEISTQMRPDTIILGECTGPETYDVLTAGNSGHQVFTTTHANSADDSVDRLVLLTSQTDLIKGKAVYDLVAAAIDLVVVVKRFPEDGSRKIITVGEVSTHTEKNVKNDQIKLPIRPIWEFQQNPNSLTMDTIEGEWVKVGSLSKEREKKHGITLEPTPTYESLKTLYPNKEEAERLMEEKML